MLYAAGYADALADALDRSVALGKVVTNAFAKLNDGDESFDFRDRVLKRSQGDIRDDGLPRKFVKLLNEAGATLAEVSAIERDLSKGNVRKLDVEFPAVVVGDQKQWTETRAAADALREAAKQIRANPQAGGF